MTNGKRSTRRLATLAIDTDARVVAFAEKLGLSMSAAINMLVLAGLNLHDGKPVATATLCGCDHEAMCAKAFDVDYSGSCRRQHLAPS